MEANTQNACKLELTVRHGLGLHARVAARIAETVKSYDCRVTFSKGLSVAEGDSVLSILTLDAPEGSTLMVEAEGPDADRVLTALKAFFEQDPRINQ